MLCVCWMCKKLTLNQHISCNNWEFAMNQSCFLSLFSYGKGKSLIGVFESNQKGFHESWGYHNMANCVDYSDRPFSQQAHCLVIEAQVFWSNAKSVGCLPTSHSHVFKAGIGKWTFHPKFSLISPSMTLHHSAKALPQHDVLYVMCRWRLIISDFILYMVCILH